MATGSSRRGRHRQTCGITGSVLQRDRVASAVGLIGRVDGSVAQYLAQAKPQLTFFVVVANAYDLGDEDGSV